MRCRRSTSTRLRVRLDEGIDDTECIYDFVGATVDQEVRRAWWMGMARCTLYVEVHRLA
jgi:hypothetical protein